MSVTAAFTGIRGQKSAAMTPSDEWLPPQVEEQPELATVGVSRVASNTAAQQVKIVLPATRKPFRTIKRAEWTETMLQQWECIVTSKDDECVSCKMYDILNETSPVEFSEIYLKYFSKSDIPLLDEGVVFYWSMGYQTNRNGTVQHFETFRVRRMPPLTASQKKSAQREAAGLSGLFSNCDA